MIGIASGTLLALFGTLVLFGLGYNLLVGWLIRNGYTEGYMGFIVAIGTTGVLLALAVLNPEWVLLTLMAFTCAGVPMIIGSVSRHVRARKAHQDALRRSQLEGLL